MYKIKATKYNGIDVYLSGHSNNQYYISEGMESAQSYEMSKAFIIRDSALEDFKKVNLIRVR